jgi:hypothetical protein
MTIGTSGSTEPSAAALAAITALLDYGSALIAAPCAASARSRSTSADPGR